MTCPSHGCRYSDLSSLASPHPAMGGDCIFPFLLRISNGRYNRVGSPTSNLDRIKHHQSKPHPCPSKQKCHLCNPVKFVILGWLSTGKIVGGKELWKLGNYTGALAYRLVNGPVNLAEVMSLSGVLLLRIPGPELLLSSSDTAP